jgi:hypothetical protein
MNLGISRGLFIMLETYQILYSIDQLETSKTLYCITPISEPFIGSLLI